MMPNVFLSHNPFLVETRITLDGQQVAPNSRLAERLGDRLQIWVEELFDLLFEYSNSADFIDLTFQGLATDFIDIQDSARKAEPRLGLSVMLNHLPVASPEDRLNRLQKLFDEACNGPLEELRSDDFRKQWGDVQEPEFTVNVIATMSAGKSTLINAMIGYELLPAKNEACTATIARITDRDEMTDFRGQRQDEAGKILDDWQCVDQQVLGTWNSDPETFKIELEGDIPAIKRQKYANLVLVDTPGPNNSQNEAHGVATRRIISSQQLPMVLYVLNAKQLSTNDDQHLLTMVRDAMGQGGKQARDRFLFVVNKIDAFDPEKGIESVEGALKNVRQYLAKNGIENPNIFPVSALLTKLVRLQNRGPNSLSRKERGELQTLIDLFVEEPTMHLMEYMPISPMIHREMTGLIEAAIARGDMQEAASIHAGVPVVEKVIEEYLCKYAYPARVRNALEILEKFLNAAEQKSQIYEALEADSARLQEMVDAIEGVQARINDSERSREFRDSLRKNKYEPGQSVKDELKKAKKAMEKSKAALGRILRGSEVSISEGKRALHDAETEIKQARQDIIAMLEDAMDLVLTEERQRLQEAYQQYVVDLFGGTSEEVLESLPAVRQLKLTATNLPTVSKLEKAAKFSRDEAVGTYKVKTGSWIKPWTWGRTETRTEYETREYMDLNRAWEDLEKAVSTDFYETYREAERQMVLSAERSVEAFIKFMDDRLDKEIGKLISEMQERTGDKDKLEQSITEAKKKLDWIENYRERLRTALSFDSASETVEG